MEIKTISELFEYADSIPDDSKFDELHEKFLDSKWVKVDDVKEMLRNFKERAKYKAKFCEDDFEQWIKELK